MVSLREGSRSKQAYTLVDIDSIDDEELRDDIILDASEGGGIYGIVVVEESVNGSVRAPIYGYYNDTAHHERWNAAKEKLGLDSEEVDDADVDQLRAAAEADAERKAAEADAAEQKELEAIAGKDDKKAGTANKSPK